VDLVLINNSAQPLRLTITRASGDSADSGCHCPHGLREPQIATGPSADQLQAGQLTWVGIDSAAFHYHSDGHRIELTIPPHTVMRVDRASALADKLTGYGLAISALELKGPTLDTTWGQTEIARAFKLRKRSLFVYEVIGSPAA